jgi:hypothetical protein
MAKIFCVRTHSVKFLLGAIFQGFSLVLEIQIVRNGLPQGVTSCLE